MPKMMKKKLRRLTVAIGLYMGLVLVAGLAFYHLRQGVPAGSPQRYLYILCGPALSLFTHMSYLLFALQSALLFPWLLLGAMWARATMFSAIGFIFSWVGVGWYMHNLF